MPIEARREERAPPAGFRWVVWNRGVEKPCWNLYEEKALWLLDKHQQSRVEAEVSELGGWGMQVAGALRNWDLAVEVEEGKDREEWFGVGQAYEEWVGVVPPPQPGCHFPGKGAAWKRSF